MHTPVGLDELGHRQFPIFHFLQQFCQLFFVKRDLHQFFLISVLSLLQLLLLSLIYPQQLLLEGLSPFQKKSDLHCYGLPRFLVSGFSKILEIFSGMASGAEVETSGPRIIFVVVAVDFRERWAN